MENLIQQDIIRAVITARESGQDIKKVIKDLAKQFNVTEFVIKGIIEFSATYGMEKVSGPKAGGKNWKPLDYLKRIEKIEDHVYRLEGQIVKLHNRINKDLGLRESRWNCDGDWHRNPNEENEEIPKRPVLIKAREAESPDNTGEVENTQDKSRIQELREKIDEVRALLDEKEERPRLTFQGIEEGKKAIPR